MSGLEDLYREIILDHYRSPRNRGELPVPPARKVEGFNPLCGDEIVLYLDIDPATATTTGTIADLRIGGVGCSISQASSSMMGAAVKGRTVAEARRIIRAFKSLMQVHESRLGGDAPAGDGAAGDGDDDDEVPVSIDDVRLGDLAALQGVVKFPVRIKCATLAWNTLAEGLDEADAG